MSDQTRRETIRGGAHRAPADPGPGAATSADLVTEVEQTWLRPRGRNRYPGSTWPSELSPPEVSRGDEVSTPEPVQAATPAPTPAPASERRSGRRASAALDPAAEAAEAAERLAAERMAADRLAADRATVAAQGEAIRRATEHRRHADEVRLREADAVRPRPSVEGATEQVVSAPPAPARRLVAGGVFDRRVEAELRDPAALAQGPDDVATRAISVIRQAGPEATAPATPFVPDRTLILGILNVTLDSFSDGGRYARFDDAVAHARSLVSDGADIVDIGGESTRPGAPRVDVHEEQRRVIPVVRELVGLGMRVSIDTMNAATAFAAVEAGAEVINDVSGGLADRNMAQVVVDTDATYIAMHWRGHSDVMSKRATYANAVAEVKAELFQRVGELVVQGVRPDRIVIDPGLGFAKLAEHNWQLLGHFDELAELGLPVLIAASRKRFLGGLLPEEAGVRERDPATAVISALSARAGAWGVRVHDVASTRAALDVWEAWQKGSRG
ncbi:dihydropteroate synthase [Frondihabitans peucedani]|uniref:dihydropteroate synthase n=1 Tax=Frondihabitans peucedani TaxID=598626 RepID=A0ABP8E1S7_9MICO